MPIHLRFVKAPPEMIDAFNRMFEPVRYTHLWEVRIKEMRSLANTLELQSLVKEEMDYFIHQNEY